MATDIVSRLFGVTTDSYQQEQQDRMDKNAFAVAQLDPFQQANYNINRGGSMLGGAVGGMLGGQDPMLQRISMRQQIAGQINPNDLDSFRSGIEMMRQGGDGEGAFMLNQELQKILVNQSTIAKNDAQATQAKAAATRERTPPTPEKILLARQVALRAGEPGTPENQEAFYISLDQQMAKETPEPSEIASMKALGIPLTQDGYEIYRGLQRNDTLTVEERIRIAAAGRAPRAEPPLQPPVAVVDPVTGKQVLVTREEALSRRMTPAAAMESLPPKEIQKREAALPQATSSIKGFETKSAGFIKDLEMLRDSPGLDSITGIAAGRLPGITPSGRAAEALYNKITAKGGFQALQDMRDASKTGGALGNVSNQEGKQLTASFAAIDRRQDSVNVKAALNQAIADIQGSQTRMREAYDATYNYKSTNIPSGGVITNPSFPGFSIGKP